MLVKLSDLISVSSYTTPTVDLQISRRRILYDYLTITTAEITTTEPKIEVIPNIATLNLITGKVELEINNKIFVIKADGILVHYFVQELRISPTYRKSFMRTVNNLTRYNTKCVIIKLVTAQKEIIDYAWNYRTTYMIWERLELDHALSWLSTLGGAFSALGDYFTNCALIAGKISFHQLKLALRLGDPTVAARCKLYMSLSLIQRGYLRIARKIISQEYETAKNAIVVDTRLIKMCQGIWAKLKYERSRKRKNLT